MHHTVGGRQVDGAIGIAVEGCLCEGVMLGIERDDGGTVLCCRHGIVILRDMMLHKLLHDGSAVATQQAVILGIVDGTVDRSPHRIEARAVEGFREVALLGKGCKLRQLLVTGDILPQRIVGSGLRICRHRVVVVVIGAGGESPPKPSQREGCQGTKEPLTCHAGYISVFDITHILYVLLMIVIILLQV